LPYLKEEASICIKLYDLAFENETASGCAKIEVELAHVKLAVFNLGCFHLGPTQHFFISRDPELIIDDQLPETEVSERKARIIDEMFYDAIKKIFKLFNHEKSNSS
jgi:hypothetical protein